MNEKLNPIELAAWIHAEFVKIYPFRDGNGRTSRLIMNYQLIKNGYMPINVKKEDRLDYYEKFEEYTVNNKLEAFLNFIFRIEYKKLDKFQSLFKEIENELDR